MPWNVPSHQAPVLPLKRWWPDWFSGLALVLGTVVPDLVFILQLDETGSPVSHTFAGQILLTMPLVVCLHALLTHLVLPWLLPRVPGGPPLHLHALAGCRPARDPLALAKVAISGLVGGLTHVTIDGFTHGDASGWALPLLPVLGTQVPTPLSPIPLHDVLQVVLTIGLGVVALRSWDRMAWRRQPVGVRRAVAGAFGSAALVGAILAPLAKGALGTPEAAKLAVYGAISACCLSVVAGALLDRIRLLLLKIQLEVRAALEAP
jgi:hypothetical protein